MIRDEKIIQEINTLWLPVYPYMVEYLLEVSAVRGGRFLDLGPFAGGLAVGVLRSRQDLAATVIDESDVVLEWAREQAVGAGTVSRLTTLRAALEPLPAKDGAFDLVAVRGAFFFLTPALLREVARVLKPGGFGWVGGGYGPETPQRVIAPIAARSKVLNEAVGKRHLSPGEAERLVRESGLERSARVTTEGGLWIEVRVPREGAA